MTKLLRRLQYWLHHGKMDAELAEEMEFHRAMLAVGADLSKSEGEDCGVNPRLMS